VAPPKVAKTKVNISKNLSRKKKGKESK
jgi:hypothetical protein